jgi:DNA-binding response OmpR family regulator
MIRQPGTASPLAGAEVLVVEDDAIIALDLKQALEELGCVVLGPAATVGEALLLLDRVRPRAVLLDLGLGGELATPVADALTAAAVPFLLVTGYGDRDLNEPAVRGAPRLAKPFGVEALEAALLDLLAGGNKG